MKQSLKITISLLITTVLTALFSIFAFSGFFLWIETQFYDPRLQAQYQKQIESIAREIDQFHENFLERFQPFLKNDYIASAFLKDQTLLVQDIVKRNAQIQQYKEEYKHLLFIRFIDSAGKLHFSTLDTDIQEKKKGSDVSVFKDYIKLDESIKYDDLLVLKDESLKMTIDGNKDRFIYSFPIVDKLGIYKGTALFYYSKDGLVNFLLTLPNFNMGDNMSLLEQYGIIINFPQDKIDTIKDIVKENWLTGKGEPVTHAGIKVLVDNVEKAFQLFTVKTMHSGNIGVIVNQDVFEIQFSFKIILLTLAAMSLFLLVYLILNLRQDPFVIISARVKQFEIRMLRELVENKEDVNWNKWYKELLLKSNKIKARIKNGIRYNKKYENDIDDLINRSWEEILSVIAKRTEAAAPANIDISRIEELITKLLKNTPIVVSGNQIISAQDTGKTITGAKVIKRTIAQDKSGKSGARVDEQELEEVTEAEAAEEVLEEVTEAEAAEEVLEEVPEAEAAEEVLEEVPEAAEEVLEEAPEAEAAEEVLEEVPEAEAAEEVLEEVPEAEAEAAEEVTEAEAVEEAPEEIIREEEVAEENLSEVDIEIQKTKKGNANAVSAYYPHIENKAEETPEVKKDGAAGSLLTAESLPPTEESLEFANTKQDKPEEAVSIEQVYDGKKDDAKENVNAGKDSAGENFTGENIEELAYVKDIIPLPPYEYEGLDELEAEKEGDIEISNENEPALEELPGLEEIIPLPPDEYEKLEELELVEIIDKEESEKKSTTILKASRSGCIIPRIDIDEGQLLKNEQKILKSVKAKSELLSILGKDQGEKEGTEITAFTNVFTLDDFIEEIGKIRNSIVVEDGVFKISENLYKKESEGDLFTDSNKDDFINHFRKIKSEKKIYFSEQGLELDDFLTDHQCKGDIIKELKALIFFSRRINAIGVALLVKGNNGNYDLELSIGLTENSKSLLNFNNEHKFVSEYFDRKRIVIFNQELAKIKNLKDKIAEEDHKYIKNSAFMPAVYNKGNAVLFIAFPFEKKISLEKVIEQLNIFTKTESKEIFAL